MPEQPPTPRQSCGHCDTLGNVPQHWPVANARAAESTSKPTYALHRRIDASLTRCRHPNSIATPLFRAIRLGAAGKLPFSSAGFKECSVGWTSVGFKRETTKKKKKKAAFTLANKLRTESVGLQLVTKHFRRPR